MSAEYDVSKAFKRVENRLIDSMMRNLAHHRAEELAEGYDWEQWQVLQLRELEKYRKENPALFAGDFDSINKRIDGAFNGAYQDAGNEAEAKILKEIKAGNFTPQAAPIEGDFFGLNASRLEHLVQATRQDFVRGEWSVLRQANDEYRRIIFDAQMYSASGATYEQAVDMATKDFLKNGIQSITYKNGAKHTMQDYARMAIRTGQKRAYLMGEGDAADKYGIHTVRVNKRLDACPLCVKWLGKVLVDDVYAGGTDKEAKEAGVPLLSEAMAEGFLHPNCKDIYTLYIEGVSKPAEPWSKEEIQQIADGYNAEQAAQRAEDIKESYDRMAKYSLDPVNKARYEARALEWGRRLEVARERLAAMAKIEPVPAISHEGIRAPIDVEYGNVTIKGVADVTDVLEMEETTRLKTNGAGLYRATLKKQVRFPWDTLGTNAKNRVGWFAPSRVEKDFIIQKKDLRFIRAYSKQATSYWDAQARAAKEAGYKLVGGFSADKYNWGWDVFILEKDDRLYFAFEGVEAQRSVSKSTIKAIRDREEEVASKLWRKGVRFRDLTARRGDNWIHAMEEFHTVVEADKPVTLVSREAYDAVKGEEIYRGISPASHLRKDLTMTKTPKECAEQLMEGGVGDCFPSRGIYGDCVMYGSNSVKTGADYASSYGDRMGGYITRMKLKEDAIGITYDDAKELFNAIADATAGDKYPFFSRRQVALSNDVEVGKAMQMLGYDYIFQPRGDGMDVHFYMILNREALVAPVDDWVEAVITPQNINRLR